MENRGLNNPSNGWSRWSDLILDELKSLNQILDKISVRQDLLAQEHTKLAIEMATLKTMVNIRSGFFSIVGTGIAVLIVILMEIFKKSL